MIKGYKVFNPDWTCLGFKYEVGKTYKHNGDISICESGFHFCQVASDCFSYYRFDNQNKVAEVDAIGFVQTADDKSVTDEIRIVREISWPEVLTIVNTGKNCTGLCNTGNNNSGNRNTGGCNSGSNNSGECNSGSYNSGSHNVGGCNSGSYNSGDCNSGDCNSGSYNSGGCNSGDWNDGNWNSGFFSTITPCWMFEKPTSLTYDEVQELRGMQILGQNYENNWWIQSQNMSEEEKEAHPEHEAKGGYIKTVSFTEACKIMWNNLSSDEKKEVRNLPNFDADIFERITGIR